VKAIQENINIFELDQKMFKVFKSDFRQTIKKVTGKVDLIFLDPPFIATKYYDEALELILKSDILSDHGVIVLEKPYKVEINGLSKYTIKVNKRFGEKDIVFLGR
jgi:16S rRNA G966 N2-methylase RsmD